MSTADQALMVAPPWVLGLGGNAEEPCNARTTNLMGNYSVAELNVPENYTSSVTSAGNYFTITNTLTEETFEEEEPPMSDLPEEEEIFEEEAFVEPSEE